jgi:phosphoribosylamine--glycine ligase
VLAAAGYPDQPEIGQSISGIERAESLAGVKVFHSGTRRDENGVLMTSGGRVLSVMARQVTLEAARAQAYRAVECINFKGEQYRHDIAGVKL